MKAPWMSNGAMRISPTAFGSSNSCATSAPTEATPHDGPPMPKRATSSLPTGVDDGAHAGVPLERMLGLRVVEQPGPSGHAAVRRARRRSAGTDRGPDRSTSSHPPAARPSRWTGVGHPRGHQRPRRPRLHHRCPRCRRRGSSRAAPVPQASDHPTRESSGPATVQVDGIEREPAKGVGRREDGGPSTMTDLDDPSARARFRDG